MKFLTEETPAKVMSLAGVALFSMFFLLGASASNASFAGMENQLPNPFAPEKVVAVIDSAANSYSNFLAMNLFEPVKADYAMYKDNASWVMDNSSESIVAIAGLQKFVEPASYQSVPQGPAVAGAYTEKKAPVKFSLDKLYSMLIE